jgi:4-hydroxybenzoate polyprenyltransferase
VRPVGARPVADADRRTLGAVLVALRPRQWTKNGLLFVALAFTANLHQPDLVARAVAACLIFCALSSAGYLANDILDAGADRRHPTKRRRPVAAGLVSVPVAVAVSAALAVAGVGAALALGPAVAGLALGYLLLTAAYTAWLKHLALLDVFGIAAGFVLRAAAGAAAIGVAVSPWLYVATMLGALLIALGKRRAELATLGAGAARHRRSLGAYSVEFLDQLMLVFASAAIMTYALYTFSAEHLPRDHSMMLTIPFVLHGVARYLLLIRTGPDGGAPEELFLRDRPLLATVTLWAAAATAIIYRATGLPDG